MHFVNIAPSRDTDVCHLYYTLSKDPDCGEHYLETRRICWFKVSGFASVGFAAPFLFSLSR